jgi:hypothetical protein
VRKIAAALLLLMLLFNWIGYSFVSDYLQYHSDINLEKQLDANLYNEDDLIELKLAINLPYQNNWSDYERYDGEIEYNGVSYKYVKRKVANDTLYLKCLPNTGKMSLAAAKNDYFKMTSDLSQNDQSKKSSPKSNFSKSISPDFEDNFLNISFASPTNILSGLLYSQPVESPISKSQLSPEQPPDTLA